MSEWTFAQMALASRALLSDMTLRQQVMLLVGGFILVASLVLGAAYYQLQKQNLIHLQRDDLQTRLIQARNTLISPAAELSSNVLLLSHLKAVTLLKNGQCTLPVLDASIDQADCPALEGLAQVFESTLLSHPNYVQVRLIGLANGGRELLRVDRRGNMIVRIPESELQTKGERPYVVETMRRKAGEIYISPLELNQEHGRIEMPPMPVLRAATPLFSNLGEPFGLLIINVAYAEILNGVEAFKPKDGQVFVTTSQGDILHGPDPSMSFGHELGQAWRMQDELPEMAAWFEHPTPKFFGLRPNLVSASKAPIAAIASAPEITLVMTRPVEAIVHPLRQKMILSLLVVAGLLGIGMFIGRLLATRISRNLQQLTLATRHFAEGTSNTPIPQDGSWEIQQLSAAFESMRHQAEARDTALRDQQTYLQTIIETATEAVITSDARGLIEAINPAAEKMFGYAAEEMLGKNVSILMPSTYADHHDHWISRYSPESSTRPSVNIAVLGQRKDGSTFPLSIGLATYEIKGKRKFTAFILDISSLHAAEEAIRQSREIENLAFFDPLTHLPNRRKLQDKLKAMLEEASSKHRKLALLMIDLDGFKDVNDRLGHAHGDQLLQIIGQRLLKAVRGGDLVARLGGDEFAIVLDDVSDKTELERPLQHILDSINEDIPLGLDQARVSASIGISLYPENAEKIDDLMRQADIAMYQAKAAGRSRFAFFIPDMETHIIQRHSLNERLERALKHHEFELYYQPQVNLDTGTVTGAEALIRWNDPEKGPRSPGDFIPLAEESDLIVQIDRWVMREAVRQIETWNRLGLELEISVNVAARGFQKADFIDVLRDLLAAHPQVEPRQLKLEITETTAMRDYDRVRQIILECRTFGVNFSLDDFGTGFSSLTYLQRLPVESIKIDRSFVSDLLIDANDAAITKGIIDMARLLGLTVIAEGVENEHLVNRLIDYGCKAGQGYGIAQPMPAAQLFDWVKNWLRPESWISLSEQASILRHFSLRFARQSHTDWLHGVMTWVESGNTSKFPKHIHTDDKSCAFGRWLDGQGAQIYSHHPLLEQVKKIHSEIHAIAIQIIELVYANQHQQAKERLPELTALRDRLFEALEQLEHEDKDRAQSVLMP